MTDQTARTTAFYDAIDAFQRTHRLPGLQHAQIRSLLAEHLARVFPAESAVTAPATNQQADWPSCRAGLREQLRRAVCEAEGFAWDSDMLEPDEYGEHADTVLAVLYREWPWLRAEAEDATPPAAAPAVDRATLRDRIADAISRDLLAHRGRLDQGLLGIVPRLTNAVLAVLPLDHFGGAAKVMETDTSRAATLAGAIRRVEDPAERAKTTTGLGLGWEAARDVLRRMADEEQQQPCTECGHPQAAHEEGDDPVTPGMCSACSDSDCDHDYMPAAGPLILDGRVCGVAVWDEPEEQHMTPADELRTAAEKLRPSSPAVAAHTVAVRLTPVVVEAFADWLETTAIRLDHHTHPGWQDTVEPNALAVARAINGGKP